MKSKFIFKMISIYFVDIGGIIVSITGIIILYLVHLQIKRRQNSSPKYR